METNENTGMWSLVEGNLITEWGRKIDPSKVLQEYPRPQAYNPHWMNLNGLWDYAVTPLQQEKPSDYQGKILVPFPIESALSGVKRRLSPEENLWYRRSFTLLEGWNKGRVLLNFGAVDWKAEVWINGHRIGEHTGGFYPFSFDITETLQEGSNELLVKVWDPTDSYGQERGKQSSKPKGIFYTPVSGIWQTVWIELVPNNYIKSFKFTPDIDREELKIAIDARELSSDVYIEAEVLEPGLYLNKELNWDEGTIAYFNARASDELIVNIPKVKLWSPDTPYLYPLILRLYKGQELIQELKSYFAMRSFGTGRDDKGIMRLLLNNAPCFHNGVLDQGYWPDGLYTAPCDAALKYDLEVTKDLGFNMTRKHIKVEPARWYYHCDRIGLIVWQDMINGGSTFNLLQHAGLPNFLGVISRRDDNYKRAGREDKENKDNYKKELKELIDALYNVPSIAVWVPFNEDWGQFDAKEAAQWVKSYDPTRTVDHASGWQDQGAGDIKSLHIYFKKLSLPKEDRRAIAITEYGGYSLNIKDHLWIKDKEFGYRSYKSLESLQEAYTALMEGQVKPLVSKGLSAAIYTQLTDVETEINGLITYDRKVIKVDKELSKELNTIKL